MSPSAPPATPRPLLAAPPRPRTPVVLTATVSDGAIVLATRDGDVAVQVPLDDRAAAAASSTVDLAAPPVSVVCALDAALARRLFRRVSAWHADDHGRLSARVRPAA